MRRMDTAARRRSKKQPKQSKMQQPRHHPTRRILVFDSAECKVEAGTLRTGNWKGSVFEEWMIERYWWVRLVDTQVFLSSIK
jgi:hypothetical protein